jgi:predicted DNA-binding protein (MmcQ/YjbR family)
MTPAAFHAAALALKGATFDVKWGVDRIYSVGGKMFAAASPPGEPAPHFSFKVSDIAFDILVEQGIAIPAPYLARAKWVQLVSPDALPARALKSYLAQAHALVAARLTKKLHGELGLG